MKISFSSSKHMLITSIILLVIAISFAYIEYYTSMNKSKNIKIDRDKLREIYELEIPRIDHLVNISMEYINKLEESLKNNLTEIKSISINDTVFRQFVETAISYMKIAEKTDDTWKKLKYLRKAYFELEKARAYYLYKLGKINLQILYNETHHVEKIFREHKKEILGKDIYVGRDINTAVTRSYEIEYLLTIGESYIYDAYRTLKLEDLPLEMRIVNTASDLAVVKTIIADSSELYKEVFQRGNNNNAKSYKQVIINTYWKIHDLVKKIADEKLRNVDSKTYLYDLKDTIYGYIRFSENHYKQKYYSTALIEIIKAYAHLQCIEAAKKVPSFEELDSQINISLNDLYRVKKELVNLIREKLEKYKNNGIMLLIIKDGYYEIGFGQKVLSWAIYNDTSVEKVAYHINVAYMFFTVFKEYYENIDKTYDLLAKTLYKY